MKIVGHAARWTDGARCAQTAAMPGAPTRLPAAAYRILAGFYCALTEFDSASEARIKRGGMTARQYLLLVQLAGAPDGLSVGEIARELHITHNSAVGLSQRAERAGLLSRAPDPARRQRTLLRLTPPGARRVDAVTRTLVGQLDGERVQLAGALTRWDALLHSVRGEPVVQAAYDLHQAARGEKPVLHNLLQLYLHELSWYQGGDLDERGRYAYPRFGAYWKEAGHHPYLLRVERSPAGFALIQQTGPAAHAFSEFYIVRAWRGGGLGRRVAVELLRERPGPWTVTFHGRNAPARHFWQDVVSRAASGTPGEEPGDSADRVRLRFEVAPA